MYVLLVIFSGLTFFKDEPILSTSTYTQEFRSKDRCLVAQKWVLENTDAKVACFHK